MRDIDHIEPLPIAKKPAIFFAACDEQNFPYAVSFWNSLTKFHKPEDIDMILYTTEKRPQELKKLPKGIKIEDLTERLKLDPMFWYKQKPVLAEPLLRNYDLVVGFDVDQIILGSLDYILNTKDYDVGTVLNFNARDAEEYGVVGGWGIEPAEYFNCGMVALRSEKFAHHWAVLCYSEQFNKLQYKEQDLLNILCYYGNYNVRCFDHGDGVAKMEAWWGLFAKTWWNMALMKDGKVILPKNEQEGKLPLVDTELKIIHMAGGNRPNKMGNVKTYFQDEVSDYIDSLVKPS